MGFRGGRKWEKWASDGVPVRVVVRGENRSKNDILEASSRFFQSRGNRLSGSGEAIYDRISVRTRRKKDVRGAGCMHRYP